MSINKTAAAIGFCEFCRKLSYSTRNAAKQVGRTHRPHKQAYPCPLNDAEKAAQYDWEQNFFPLYHVGALARPVSKGWVTRGEFYGGETA